MGRYWSWSRHHRHAGASGMQHPAEGKHGQLALPCGLQSGQALSRQAEPLDTARDFQALSKEQ